MTTDTWTSSPGAAGVPGARGSVGVTAEAMYGAGTPEAVTPLDSGSAAALRSWESECACPGPCLRDHERD
jgi:hypothetical protein